MFYNNFFDECLITLSQELEYSKGSVITTGGCVGVAGIPVIFKGLKNPPFFETL
jgi:hypothetical protein